MQLPLRGIPCQRYSPTEDYTYDHQHEVIQNTTRRPLGESTGNSQPQSLAALALCHQNQLSLSSPLHSIPTPPILPTQAITSTYATSFRNQRSLHRNVFLQESPMAHSRGGRNPIYSWKHFADYRAKVKQKELEKDGPKWPMSLEDLFLDGECPDKPETHGRLWNPRLTRTQALLLIPQMGRKKFSSKGVLYGRNMLISEYMWISYWTLYPPAPGEVLPVGKAREHHPIYGKGNETDGGIFRCRKQTSSHIQVFKNFFLPHPLCKSQTRCDIRS
jgi:transcriptional enhancer factor